MARVISDEEAALRIQEALGDVYDLSQVEYVNSTTNITIICPKHGEVKKLLRAYMKGIGCTQCHVKCRIDTSVVLERFRKAHGDKYDYSEVEYTHNAKRVSIRCAQHGSFLQSPSIHWKGSGCPRCAKEQASSYTLTTDEIIKKFTVVHSTRYDYSQTVYVHSTVPLDIICTRHGVFRQTPNNHLRGSGCARCTEVASKPEMRWADAIETITGWKVDRQKKIDGIPKPVDMCVESSPFGKLAIEYDGCYWHSREGSIERDERKTALLIDAGYQVIRLREISKYHYLPEIATALVNYPVAPTPSDISVEELVSKIENSLSA